MIMMGISGVQLTAEEKKFIIQNNIGGVILFSRNYQDPQQLFELCSEIQSLSQQQEDRAPLFIGIDQEGGRVQRIKTSPFTVWPPLDRAGQLDNTTLTFTWSNLLSEELRAFGINLNFAPSLDVFTNPANKVIGDRAISSDCKMVEKHASAWVRGAIKAGVLSCAKHFPGHGNTLLDSHIDLPVENTTRAELDARELVPFKKAFRSKVDFVMLAHIVFPQIDPKWPASLSSIFVNDILRKDLFFRGLIITDDLDMGALTRHHSKAEIAVRSVDAGAEILLYCNEPDSPVIAMESLIKACESGRLKKDLIEQTHLRISVEKKQKLQNSRALDFEEALEMLKNPERQKFADEVRAGRVPDMGVWKSDVSLG